VTGAILRVKETGEVHHLDRGTMWTIGRIPEREVPLRAHSVSRLHAAVTWHIRWFIEDRGSAGGTFVNGRRITRIQPLVSGDTVTVGAVVLAFEDRGLAPVREGAPSPKLVDGERILGPDSLAVARRAFDLANELLEGVRAWDLGFAAVAKLLELKEERLVDSFRDTAIARAHDAPESGMRIVAARVLSMMAGSGDARAARTLEMMRRDASQTVRTAVIRELRKLGLEP
jgi:hypothetical protein